MDDPLFFAGRRIPKNHFSDLGQGFRSVLSAGGDEHFAIRRKGNGPKLQGVIPITWMKKNPPTDQNQRNKQGGQQKQTLRLLPKRSVPSLLLFAWHGSPCFLLEPTKNTGESEFSLYEVIKTEWSNLSMLLMI
jgi:hypothetical protein